MNDQHISSHSLKSRILSDIFSDMSRVLGVETLDASLAGVPPKPEMGDVAFPCFQIAKERKQSPAQVAQEFVTTLSAEGAFSPYVQKVEAQGPYINIFLNPQQMAQVVLEEIRIQGSTYGSHEMGKGKKYLIEFACPNPLKAFHLGHLKNLITGESVVRVFENAGYEVMRVNYQGDVGMHVAKALWGIFDWKDQFESVREKSIKERVEFLGKAYAHGAQHYESSDAGKEEVVRYNDIVYEDSDADVMKVYAEARSWSLEYFENIYHRLNSGFDKLFFESQMFRRGVELVEQGLQKGIFKKSEGAIIFEGSAHGLHDRVFINSKGFPTYEAKDMALAEAHFAEFDPDMVIHVVGKEQTDYFRVIFQAMELLLPQTKGKEYHLIGGFLQLKGNQKMSSRTGNIVTGDELMDAVRERVSEVMKETMQSKPIDFDEVLEKVTSSALKYGMLKSHVSQDVSFDLEESVSVSGESGPYLLYICARIKSILKKFEGKKQVIFPETIAPQEKALVFHLSEFADVTALAVTSYNPSVIARYLFDLAQHFNSFYQACPVLKAEEDLQQFRIALIEAVLIVMEKGLHLLGIESVEEM